MDNGVFISYLIEERSFVSYVKREIHNLVKDYFSEVRTGEIDIIVSELTSNMIKHAQRGELLYRLHVKNEIPVFEVIALDNGPGIKDIHTMMKDGISSTNTLGHGLGSIKRLSNYFDLFSQPGKGTVIYSMVNSETTQDVPEEENRGIVVGAISVCKPGETKCGDGYSVIKSGAKLKLFLGDGLGHGEHAHEAVNKAIASFKALEKEPDPTEILKKMHEDVKKTRGLVASVVIINTKDKTIRTCGIGNITTGIYNGIILKNNMPYNGIVGLNIPRTINSSEMILEKYQTLVLYSDGIKTRWDLSQYTGLLKHSPVVIAAMIYKENARKTDDMSVLVARVK